MESPRTKLGCEKENVASMWQFGIVIALILAAGMFLGRRIWKKLTGKHVSTNCGAGCEACPQSTPNSPPVVSLDQFTSSLDRLNSPRN